MTFEAAPAAAYAPHEIHTFSTNNDPHDVLPPAAQKKWTALVQRVTDAHNAMPEFAIRKDAAEAVTVIQRRISDLTRLKSEGGFGLSDDAGTVIAERKKLERATAQRDLQQALYEVRGARWNTCAQLRAAASDWLLRGGIPHGCVIESVEDAPLAELLKKGERISDGVERYRHRLRELAADLHRVKSAPWPSSVAKAAAKAQIEALAAAAAPDCESAIEFGSQIGFVTKTVSAMVHNVEAPAIAFVETPDTLGLFCWLFKDQLLAKINAGLDEAADDKAALSQQQREQMEAQIMADTLMIEHSECALIWHAEEKGEVLDFRSDTTPMAVLGLRLVNQPRASSLGTSPEHGYDVVGVRR
jgi:hypothetical protein